MKLQSKHPSYLALDILALNGETDEAVQAHVAACPICQKYVDRVRHPPPSPMLEKGSSLRASPWGGGLLDLSTPRRGELGPGQWFSDLFVSALEGRFTGGVLIESPEGGHALFFNDGDPVHAAGTGFVDHFLGQTIVALKIAPAAEVIEVLRAHEALPEADRPLFGQFLTARLGIAPLDIEHALRVQVEARFASCFKLEKAAFQSAPGEDLRIAEIGLKTDGWPILFRGLIENGSEQELRETADLVLGSALRLKGTLSQLEQLAPLEPELRRGLTYLEKFRKPDQLERVLGRRRARGLFRLLKLLDVLERGALGKAIGIPKAGTLSAQTGLRQRPSPLAVARWSAQPEGRPAAPSAVRRVDPRAIEEVRAFHARLDGRDHFALLDVGRDDPIGLIRKKRGELAKKFHPDAFSSKAVPPEVLAQAEEILAKLNEAFEVLANPDARQAYEALLAEGGGIGESHRHERVRDAEFKTKKALVLLKNRDFESARALLRSAAEQDPFNRLIKAHLAWTLIADAKFDRDRAFAEALPLLMDAVKTHGEDANVHFYLGRLYKEQGSPKKALEHFKTAARLDPKFMAAEQETRLLMKRLSESTPKTTFRRRSEKG